MNTKSGVRKAVWRNSC